MVCHGTGWFAAKDLVSSRAQRGTLDRASQKVPRGARDDTVLSTSTVRSIGRHTPQHCSVLSRAKRHRRGKEKFFYARGGRRGAGARVRAPERGATRRRDP